MSLSPGSENELTELKEAISFVESLLKDKKDSINDTAQKIYKFSGLSIREKLAFTAAWKNETYQNVIIQNNNNLIKQNTVDVIKQNIIVENNNYAENSIKNSASFLYKKLTELFKEEKITKKTLKRVVQSAWKSRQGLLQQQPTYPLSPPNWQNPQLLNSLTEHQEGISSVAINPDGKTLASGSWDNTIKLWDLESGKLLHTLTGHLQDVASITFLDEKTLLSASYDKTIKRWHLNTGKLLSSFNKSPNFNFNGHSRGIECFALSPDGEVLASGSHDQTVKLWNIFTGQEIHTFCCHATEVISIAFNQDGWILASGSMDGGIKLWNLKQPKFKPKKTLKSHLGWVVSLAFSPNGKTLFSGSKNGKIEKWDLDSGQLIDTLDGHSGAVFSLAFTPDGQTLVSGSWDKTIKLWNFHDGRVLQTLEGHSDVVMSVNFSPDGQTLVSGSGDKTIKIWRASNERLKIM